MIIADVAVQTSSAKVNIYDVLPVGASGLKVRFRFLEPVLQSAVTNGHWCGGKRPQCGASAASLS